MISALLSAPDSVPSGPFYLTCTSRRRRGRGGGIERCAASRKDSAPEALRARARASSFLRLRPNAASMSLNNAAGDSEPQPCARLVECVSCTSDQDGDLTCAACSRFQSALVVSAAECQ